ncbi:MAG TPA: hypothetical protein VMW91_04750 [Desulfosporosinus sp.]|nr:hypothetical protein [Desulfosporosinus sp.]
MQPVEKLGAACLLNITKQALFNLMLVKFNEVCDEYMATLNKQMYDIDRNLGKL